MFVPAVWQTDESKVGQGGIGSFVYFSDGGQ